MVNYILAFLAGGVLLTVAAFTYISAKKKLRNETMHNNARMEAPAATFVTPTNSSGDAGATRE
ncbi:hypothetical protein A2U01_0079750 [Trifolium medium]|uniref:Uncharacterized protein n=1 Tax=Trifolium medium TaxID=97028 RepID=A0A392TEY5_9FABA|nr:hypothetical protein [Trifolium medium]